MLSFKIFLIFFLLISVKSSADYFAPSNLPFYKEPSTFSPPAGYLKSGEKILVLERGGDFYKVKVEDGTGWIETKYPLRGKGLFVLRENIKLRKKKGDVEPEGCEWQAQAGMPGILIDSKGDWVYVNILYPEFLEKRKVKEGWVRKKSILQDEMEVMRSLQILWSLDRYMRTKKREDLEDFKGKVYEAIRSSPFWKGEKKEIERFIKQIEGENSP